MSDWLFDHLPHILGVAVVGFFIGLGLSFWANSIGSGYVIDKAHIDDYWTTSCTTSNKVTTCMPQYHPEAWKLELSANGDTGWVSVDSYTWMQYDIGEHYPDPK